MSGRLVLVGTPIGNMGDLAPRAVEALGSADLVACEDRRRTGRLLERAGIRARRLTTVNDHTEIARIGAIVARIERGETVAVVSDAGMPGIADPGERLVRAVSSAGHTVEVVPGPSAAVAGLVVSGLPAGRFCFEGFLPRKGSGRSERLAALAVERRTSVLFEAPHRLARTLTDLEEVLGEDRAVVIARELTKLHEEVWRGSVADAVVWAASDPPRGEIVIVVDGAPAPGPPTAELLSAAVTALLAEGASKKDAAATVARRFGVAKRDIYELANDLG